MTKYYVTMTVTIEASSIGAADQKAEELAADIEATIFGVDECNADYVEESED